MALHLGWQSYVVLKILGNFQLHRDTATHHRGKLRFSVLITHFPSIMFDL